MKTAVILFNLGGPDSKAAIEPFLMNFFTDPNIVRLPKPFRYLLAKYISFKRSRREASVSYAELGDKSPLLANSTAQGAALEELLNAQNSGEDFKTFICMRYWHPMSDEIAAKVKDWNPDRIVLLPLYPQYSTTTTRSSWQAWQEACKKLGLTKPSKLICCYPAQSGFIESCAANVKTVYEKAAIETGMSPRVLFSAHGLPESIIKSGDPYRSHVELSAKEIIVATGLKNPDWQLCFQSRVGRQKWLEPSTEQALHKAAHDGVPVVILPHAFTQEHVETLVEIEIEYRLVAEELGVPGFYRVPTPNTDHLFIQGLADMVRASHSAPDIAPDVGVRICDSKYKQCAMEDLCGGCAHG